MTETPPHVWVTQPILWVMLWPDSLGTRYYDSVFVDGPEGEGHLVQEMLWGYDTIYDVVRGERQHEVGRAQLW